MGHMSHAPFLALHFLSLCLSVSVSLSLSLSLSLSVSLSRSLFLSLTCVDLGLLYPGWLDENHVKLSQELCLDRSWH